MIKIKRCLAVLALGSGLALTGSGFLGAQAAKLNSGDLTGLSCSNGSVSLLGAGYTACAGAFSGNDTGRKGTLLDKLNDGSMFGGQYTTVAGASWEILGKSDESGPVFADNDATAGQWQAMLDRVYGTIVVSLKSSTAYSTYLFTNVTTADLNGLFDTAGTSLNKKGSAQALSHLTLAYYNAPAPQPPPEPPASVPEPGIAMGLLALGTLGLGQVKARQRS